MPSRLRGVLAVLPVLLAFVLVPSASATCGLIDAYVPSGKSWYGAADAPPTVLFDMADDENSQKDFFNVTTQGWLSAVHAGAFGFTTTPPWNAYAAGSNYLEAQLHCASGLQTMGTVVRFDPWIPTVAWSSPAPGAWLRGPVALQLTGSDSLSGVASYAYSLPTGSVPSADGATTFDTTGAADGTQVLSAVSVDLVGNRSAAVTRVVRIDNGAPGVSVDVAASAFVASPTMTVSATASDAQSGVAQVRFEGRTGGTGAWQALGSDGEAPYRITLATPAVEGDYDLRAIATDAIGNEGTSAVGTRVIDRIAPATALNAVQAVLTGTVGLSAVASDGGSGIARVDFQVAPAGSDDWQSLAIDDSAPYSARVASPGLPDGSYAMRVVARDAAGNEAISGLRSTVVRNSAVPASGPAGSASPAAAAAAAAIAAGKQAVTLTARALPHRVEGGHAIVVAGVAKGLARGIVVVTLQNARRPGADPARAHDHREERTLPRLVPAALLGPDPRALRRRCHPSHCRRRRRHRPRPSAADRHHHRDPGRRRVAREPARARATRPGRRPGARRLAGTARTRRCVAALLPHRRSARRRPERPDRRHVPRERTACRQPLPARRAGRRGRLVPARDDEGDGGPAYILTRAGGTNARPGATGLLDPRVRDPGGQEAVVSVEVTIVVLWMAFPVGLACVAGGRIGRALARLRQLEA